MNQMPEIVTLGSLDNGAAEEAFKAGLAQILENILKEADGGAWRLQAMTTVRTHLESELSLAGLVETIPVIS